MNPLYHLLLPRGHCRERERERGVLGIKTMAWEAEWWLKRVLRFDLEQLNAVWGGVFLTFVWARYFGLSFFETILGLRFSDSDSAIES
jgi:hypothetical protein